MRFFSVGLLMCGSLFFTGCSTKTMVEVGGGMSIGGIASGGTAGSVVSTVGSILNWTGRAIDNNQNVSAEIMPNEDHVPGTVAYEKAQAEVLTWVLADFFLENFKEKLAITEKTTPEQIKAAAKSTCADIDKMVAGKEGLVVSSKAVYQLNIAYIPPDAKGDVSLPVDANPFGENCEAKLGEAGDKMKPLPIKEAAQ